jgi:glycosyltransferase involved in cell wall biosynthesis
VLSCIGAYWPGNDSSGANQSFKALATALRGDIDFTLLARAAPFGIAAEASAGESDLGFARALYMPTTRRGAQGLARRLASAPHDVLWLNGFFDREITIPALLMRQVGRIPRRPTILSPRGEFFAGALALKSMQKRAYLALMRMLPLIGDVTIHATSNEACRRLLGARQSVTVAPDTPLLPAAPQRRPSIDGITRLLFVGRVARVKNLDFALKVLAGVRSRVHLDIFGYMQEPDYWIACEALIGALPANVTVSYHGEVQHDGVVAALAGSDLMFLPTTGENFGHAIFEALGCHVPVLISDTTPWRDLAAKGAGWDLPLTGIEGFARVIDAFAALGPEERQRLGLNARARAESWLAASDTMGRNRRMIEAAMVTAS